MRKDEDTAADSGKLTKQLMVKLLFWRLHEWIDDEDVQALRRCFPIDPRTATLILGALEFPDELFAPTPKRLIPLLLEQPVPSEPLRFLLRTTASESTGEDGMSTMCALSHLASFGDSESRSRWIFLRAAQLRHWNLCGGNYMGKDLVCDASRWIIKRALDDPALIPMLIADSLSRRGLDEEVLVVLASQNQIDLDNYELGEFRAVLAKASVLVENILEPWERAKRLVLHYRAPVLRGECFQSDLTTEDIVLLQHASEDTSHEIQGFAWRRLAKETRVSNRVKEWVGKRLLEGGADASQWAWAIAHDGSEPGLLRHATEILLEGPGHHGYGLALERLCQGSWKPSAEEGIALIRRGLQLPDREGLRYGLWELLVREYGLELGCFSDLLEEIRGSGGWRVPRILGELLKLGLHREEILSLLETSTGNLLSLAAKNGSQNPRVQWMKQAEENSDSSSCFESMNGLAIYYGSHPETRELLVRMASRERTPFEGAGLHAYRLLKILFPRDAETRQLASSQFDMGYHGFDEGPQAFDDEGFQQWLDSADGRRQRLIEGSLNSKEQYRKNCIFSLAYWFGDCPGTLLFLEGLVRASTVEPDERGFRAYCLKVMGCRWPFDERVRQIAGEAMDHPWSEMRLEAARLLSREHSSSPGTAERIARHIGGDPLVFAEYIALMTGDVQGMEEGLKALAELEAGSEWETLAHDGPLYLVKTFGPRKDLRMAFEEISGQTRNPALQESIRKVMSTYFRQETS